MLLSHIFQCLRDLDVALGELGSSARSIMCCLSGLCSLEFALTKRSPWCNGHTLVLAHGDDLALHVSVGSIPLTLIDGEGAQALLAGVCVGFDDDPGGRVRDTEVEDLACKDELVQALHDFLDAGGEVPPVHVEEVDVVCSELLQAGLDGNAHRLDGVADKV